MVWKNSSGYFDPTAGAALNRIIREEKNRKCNQSEDWGIFVEPYQRLANAIVAQAAMDYVRILRLLKHHPENKTIRQKARKYEDFFYSGWYSILTDVNPVYLIKELKKTV